MYSTGLATIFVYLASLVTFIFAMQFSGFFIPGVVLGALLFIAASATLLVMLRKRMDIQDF